MAANICTEVSDRLYPDRPFVGVGTVVFKGDDVLLIRRARDPGAGTWSLPGGKQELGETVAATAAREVREETGIEISLGPLVDVVDAIRTDAAGRVRTHYTLVDFVAEWASGELVPGDDADACAWAPPDALPGYGLWSETLRIIEAARQRRQVSDR
jgi:ADP-ribose pyrophosphatase YjhB (NUDIX family)